MSRFVRSTSHKDLIDKLHDIERSKPIKALRQQVRRHIRGGKELKDIEIRVFKQCAYSVTNDYNLLH